MSSLSDHQGLGAQELGRVSRRDQLGLGAHLFRLSWRRIPGRVLILLGLQALQVVLTAATALGMRAAVNGAIRHHPGTAVWAGVVVAAACTGTMVCTSVLGGSQLAAVEQVALLDLHPEVHRDIATLEGIEHLERTDFLDRLTVVRTGTWMLMFGFWSSIRMLFTLLQLLVTLALLGSIDPWLITLLVFAGVPLWWERRGKRDVVTAETDTAEWIRLQRHLFELATSAAPGKEIRVSGAGAELARRQRAAWDRAVDLRFRAQVHAALWKLAGWVLFTAGFAGALLLIVYRAEHGQGSVGDIVLSVTAATTLRASLQGTVSESTGAAVAGRVVAPYLWLRGYVAAERARASGGERPPRKLERGIEFEDVTYTYPGTDRKAVDGLSVRIPPGSVVAIVGEYGSGKTTLVKLLGKFYRPSAGRILVDGVDLAGLDTAAWRARSAAAFQDFGRFKTHFARNIGFGDLEHLEDRERIGRAVREANAEQLVARLPQGLDTELATELGGVDLSEGQWQKAALARASMRPEPLLFVLDEPTASLDAPSEQEIFERYMDRARRLARETGAVTVIVSHRFSTVAGADLILVLADGRLVEAGTHEQLLALDGGRYADLYGIQAEAYSAS
ncbi:MAG TPA: ABC transporter ATP-binding protein [Actinospica sp.]|nr:ABC transporter ATP-binding protein [Actinospica sp.]